MTARVPRGNEGLWSIVRELDDRGLPWSVPDVEGNTNMRRSAVGKFVLTCVAAGLAREHVSTLRTRYGRPIKLYMLTPKGRGMFEPPRFHNGEAVNTSAVEQLWRAIRTLRQFDTAELAFTASTDVLAVKEATARRYVDELARAGYLVALSERKGSGPRTVWRLKPAMNTGPFAPAILNTRAVFDRNRKQIMGEPIAALVEEAA